MNFREAVISGLARGADFSSRASRAEFWYWLLLVALGEITAAILDTAIFAAHTGFAPLPSLFTLLAVLPTAAVAARRLHDTDRSGWWLVIACTGVGVLPLLYWQYQPGTPGTNRFGPNPEEATD